MLPWLADGLVIAGAAVMVGSLRPVRQLMIQLPAGPVRRRWAVLAALTLVFIIGYLSYAGVFWNHPIDWSNLIVPVIFFGGAWFVWLTSTLSLQTVIDMRRVTRLEQESSTDPLTGISNRRYLVAGLKKNSRECRDMPYPWPSSCWISTISNASTTPMATKPAIGS